MMLIATTAAGDDERRQALQPAPDRPLGDGEHAGPVVGPDERVLLGRRADKDAVVQPLGLDELELALQVRTGEDEDDARSTPSSSSTPSGSIGP